jgi:hypothetical protein
MSGIEVHDPGDLRKYRTEIPNMVFDMGLSPHALALYGHLKRTCGANGKCWKSTRTLAEEAKMSAGKVSEARAELEEAKLIFIERPPDKTKPVEVTIADIWVANFMRFGSGARVQNMNTSRSEYESKKEPLEESVEANASSGIAKTEGSADSAKVIGLEKHVVDKLYSAFDKAGYTLDNSDYGYHLGRAKKMLEKMNPTDEELDAIATASVEHFEVYSKTDAMAALRYMRQQAARAKRLNPEQQPHWSKQTNTDKPRAALWYASTQEVTFEQAETWIKEGMTHSAIMDRIEGGAA